MSSETITRNDLTTILNEVLPFSFTEFRYHNGTITVPNSTIVSVHSETFVSGSWLILTTLETTANGSTTANLGQNRIIKDGTLVYAHKAQADNSVVNTNFYVLESANNTTISFEAFQATGNSQTQEWTYTAIRIGDKFAQGEADYIVEQGTDGIWTYRKWNSGTAECWGGFAATISNYATAFGGYAYTTTATFPSGLFASAPIVQYSAYIANAFALTGTLTTSLTKDSCNLYAISTSSGSQNTSWYVTTKGRWK